MRKHKETGPKDQQMALDLGKEVLLAQFASSIDRPDLMDRLKKKGGIGDAAEFDAVIEAAKQKTPFFFAANGASGSGASGSGKGTSSEVTMTGAAFEALSESQQRDFSLKGGKII